MQKDDKTNYSTLANSNIESENSVEVVPHPITWGVDNLTFIDFLRCTTADVANYDNFLVYLQPLLNRMNVSVFDTGKGTTGYKHLSNLIIGEGKENILVGRLATGSNKGGMFELSGKGCTLIRLSFPEIWHELYSLLVEHEFRITRTDIALDFHGEYAIEKGYTVPLIAGLGYSNGLLDKETQKGNQSMKANSIGDWAGLVFMGIDASGYDPLIHAPEGLTMYFGSRTYSPDFFRIYEKGKEQNAALPEGDTDRAYFRIEHELKRPDGKTNIPLDAMIRPDAYFGSGRPNLRALMDEMKEFYGVETSEERQRETIRKQKTKLLSKKIGFLKSQGGRLVKTLHDNGATDSQIVEWLIRSEGIKEFINDLDKNTSIQSAEIVEFNVIDALIADGLVPVKPEITGDRVSLDVSQAESGQWIAERVPV